MTVPAFLTRHGYATACFGKWHLGMNWPVEGGLPIAGDGNAAEPGSTSPADRRRPAHRGVRRVFRHLGLARHAPLRVHRERSRRRPPDRAAEPSSRYVRAGARDPAFRFDRGLARAHRPAVRYIGDRAGQEPDRPFFLYLALNAPHTPVAPSAEFQGKSGAGDYGDFVQEVDASVGRVLKALETPSSRPTPWWSSPATTAPRSLAYARVREYRHYSMGALRGVKRDVWEGGHRVPFFARWPGKIPAGASATRRSATST